MHSRAVRAFRVWLILVKVTLAARKKGEVLALQLDEDDTGSSGFISGLYLGAEIFNALSQEHQRWEHTEQALGILNNAAGTVEKATRSHTLAEQLQRALESHADMTAALIGSALGRPVSDELARAWEDQLQTDAWFNAKRLLNVLQQVLGTCAKEAEGDWIDKVLQFFGKDPDEELISRVEIIGRIVDKVQDLFDDMSPAMCPVWQRKAQSSLLAAADNIERWGTARAIAGRVNWYMNNVKLTRMDADGYSDSAIDFMPPECKDVEKPIVSSHIRARLDPKIQKDLLVVGPILEDATNAKCEFLREMPADPEEKRIWQVSRCALAPVPDFDTLMGQIGGELVDFWHQLQNLDIMVAFHDAKMVQTLVGQSDAKDAKLVVKVVAAIARAAHRFASKMDIKSSCMKAADELGLVTRLLTGH